MRRDLSAYLTGRIDDTRLDEASGLACIGDGSLWSLNDSGNGPWLFEYSKNGQSVRRVRVTGAKNRDWEDLAIINRDGSMQIVVADIGDNAGRRDDTKLLFLDTPLDAPGSAEKNRIEVLKTVGLRYPDGPRDAESIAIDSDNMIAWLLTKRTIPAEIYTVELDVENSSVVDAKMVGVLDSLPQPTAEDLARAPVDKDWFWQPTAMDFSPDGRLAGVLTYEAIYLFFRSEGESWSDAFARPPRRFELGKGWEAEAICVTQDAVIWTVEEPAPPLFRIPLSDPGWSQPTH